MSEGPSKKVRTDSSIIHGGAFTHGSTKDIGFHQVKWLMQNGVAVVSLEYRMLPQ